jgi:hypothetical protein
MLQSRFLSHVRVEQVERSTPLRPLRKKRLEQPRSTPPLEVGGSGASRALQLFSYGPMGRRAEERFEMADVLRAMAAKMRRANA